MGKPRQRASAMELCT